MLRNAVNRMVFYKEEAKADNSGQERTIPDKKLEPNKIL